MDTTATEPRPATVRKDVATARLATCLVGGLLSDGWAYVHIGRSLEGFFTPGTACCTAARVP